MMHRFISSAEYRILNARGRLVCLATVLLGTAGGCGLQSETVVAIRDAATRSIQSNSARSSMDDGSPVTAELQPPYPNRQDPFSFPQDATLVDSGPDTSITSAAALDVMGFADLGQPRVFLLARGKTHSLTVGEKLYGVEVIDIQPPVVRLRMGSLVWTATMFDKDSSNR